MSDLLRTTISEAFPVLPICGRPVVAHECEECATVERLLSGKPWPEVAESFPEYCADVFPLLTNEAKQYYVPAFMLAALNDAESFTGESVALAVERRDDALMSLSVEQRTAIVAWLVEVGLVNEAFPNGDFLGFQT